MPRLLHLDSSADRTGSRSRRLTYAVADAWRSVSPDHDVVHRDLHSDPLPHLADAAMHWGPVPAHTGDPNDPVAVQRALLTELAEADAVVVGAPMYNYSLPSSLKAWLDHVHVMGVTAGDAPTVALRGTPVVVVTTRGAAYPAGTDDALKDHVTPVLQLVLGGSMGMAVSVVSVDLTLADDVPALAAHRDTAERLLTDALAAASAAGRALGVAAGSG